MYPDLYLMRHGQTEWNAEGRIQGRLDSPLTPLGREQVRRQAQIVKDLPGRLLSSPQGRARQSADTVFAGRSYLVDPRLAEIDVGSLSGRLLSEIEQTHRDLFGGTRFGWYDRAPGGEHFAGIMTRVAGFLSDLTGPTLIVTHGVTLRVLQLLRLGWPLGRLEELPAEQGIVVALRNGRHEVWR